MHLLRLFLLSFLMVILSRSANGQCPSVSFTLPDTVCAGASFQVSNSSSGGSDYFWDLCTGDMATIPASSLLTSFAGLSYPQQSQVVFDNGEYHLFVANYLQNNLLRYDFGNSFDNPAVIHNYGTFGGVFSTPSGLDVVKENGVWYALMASNGQNKIVRVNLGSVITNNVATATSLGLFNLSIPVNLKIAKDGSDYYAFVSNSGNTTLSKISFGNSITNTPTGFTALSDPAFNSPWGFEVEYNCASNSWVGLYGSKTSSKINVIDFGTSLSNTGTIVSSFICAGLPSGFDLGRDGDDWYIVLNSLATGEFQKIKIEGSLLNAPTSLQNHVIATASNPSYVAMYRDESSFRVFMVNNLPHTIGMLVFDKPCLAQPVVSSDPVSINPTFSAVNAWQTISLEAKGPNGEVALFSDSVFVSEAPLAGFTHSAGCEGEVMIFNDTSIVNSSLTTSWLWDFGDASPTSSDQNPMHLFPAVGTYNVSLTTSYSTGCSNTFSDSISIELLPDADFTFANNQCEAVPVLFNDISQAFGNSTLISWMWDFGDSTAIETLQNPLHTFNSPGTFNVMLTVTASSGCIDTITQVITILPSPAAGFITTSTCVGETVSFINTTTITGGGSIVYDWDFGDTFTSSQIDPSHQYPSVSSNYLVTLIASATNGCKDTIVESIKISNQPVPQFNFTPTVVCKFNPVAFTSTSFGIGGDTISAYLWDFGDTNFSTDQNPFHTYSDTGFFNVTLTVTSPTACDSSLTQQLYVIPSPTAAFTASNVCFGLPVNFNPLVTTPPGTQVDSIVWTFGDGSGFTGLTSPSHLYTTPGTYPITMTVYNDLLCTAEYGDSVVVYSIPVADFTSSFGCSGSVVNFDGSISAVDNDTISSWLWNFDGLGSASGVVSQFTFANAGFYDVTLIVTSSQGCQDTVDLPVQVVQSPQFNFTYTEPCFGLPSVFNYVPDSLPAPSSILSWSFGDGSNSALLSPSHVFTTVDTFMVSLTVTHNATGCTSTIINPLVVKPYPDAGFSFVNGCENIPVQFTDTSTIVSGSIASRDWDFGSLGTSVLINPVITPIIPGNYPVTLTVTSAHGCVSSVSNTLTVYSNPEASFTTDPLFGSPPLTVNFNNTTTGGSTYNWIFGDGASAIGTNTTHIYTDTGTYHTTLIATSAQGCIDSINGIMLVLIPYLDVAVNKVFATESDSLLTLTAELLNLGNVPVNTFDIKGRIENGSVINESWTGSFQPGATMIYNFVARYEITSKTLPGFYCVEILSPNNSVDQNASNNSKCAVLSTQFELYSAYPNPFSNELSVNFNLPLKDKVDVFIYDAIGKLVYKSESMEGEKGFNKITISTVNFNKGVYKVNLRFRDESKHISVIRY